MMQLSECDITSVNNSVEDVERFLTPLRDTSKRLQVEWVSRILAAYPDDYSLIRLWTSIPSGDRCRLPALLPQAERRIRWMSELVILHLALQVRHRDLPTMELMRSISDSGSDRARAETFLKLVSLELFRELAAELLVIGHGVFP